MKADSNNVVALLGKHFEDMEPFWNDSTDSLWNQYFELREQILEYGYDEWSDMKLAKIGKILQSSGKALIEKYPIDNRTWEIK